MNRICISGGFGFLGSHLVDRLLENEDNHILVVDHGKSAVAEKNELVLRWKKNRNFQFDVTSVAAYLATSDDAVDTICHLASPVGPLGVLDYQAGTIANRIPMDAYWMAKRALLKNARMIFVSSSEVFGGGVEGVCEEGMECHLQVEGSARMEYAVGKLAAEVLLLNMANEEGLDVRIVRPFNITGPRQSPKGGFVLPRFCLQALLGLPLTVYGTGKQMRAFTHVNDIVNGLLQISEHGKAGEIYNLGNPVNRIEIYDLATLVVEAVGKGRIDLVDPQKLHGKRFREAPDKYPSAYKAMTQLGWKPEWGLKAIVQDVVDYWRNQPEEVREGWRKSLS